MGEIAAIIPARAGSRRVPHKNTRCLLGKPLVTYTIEDALESELLDHVAVTTDDKDVMQIAIDHGIMVIRRPPDLAEDVPTELVLMHALGVLEECAPEIDALCLLQPTTPIREPWEIDRCVSKWRGCPGIDTVFTCHPVHQRPEWMFLSQTDRALPYCGRVPVMGSNVSQNLPPLVYPTGGVYVISRRAVENHTIYGDERIGVEVPWTSAVDIEEEQDFLYATRVIEWIETQAVHQNA